MKKKHEKRSSASRQAPRRIKDEDLRDASGAGASLSYGKIEWKYAPQKPDGPAGGDGTAKT